MNRLGLNCCKMKNDEGLGFFSRAVQPFSGLAKKIDNAKGSRIFVEIFYLAKVLWEPNSSLVILRVNHHSSCPAHWEKQSRAWAQL